MRLLIVLAACLTGSFVMAEDAPVLLRYHFVAGESLRMSVEHQASVEATIRDSNQTTETRSDSIKLWKILDVEIDGTIRFVHSVEKIKLWQKQQGQPEMTFDSSSGETPPPAYESAAAAVGVPLTEFKIDARGTMLTRQVPEGGEPRDAANQDQILLILPEKEVKVGDVWSSPQVIEMNLPRIGHKTIHTRQQCRLVKIDSGIAEISVDSQVLDLMSQPELEAQLIQRMSAGTVKFDIQAGRMLEQQMDVNRRIVGVSGEGSVMQYRGRFAEKLLPAK